MGCGSERDSAGNETANATRTVEAPLGAVELPAQPQRVFGTTTGTFDDALVLGLPLVAGLPEQGQPGAGYAPHILDLFGDEIRGLPLVPTRPGIDIEEVAALDPDVIAAQFFDGIADDPTNRQLMEIAPFVTHRILEGEPPQQQVIPY